MLILIAGVSGNLGKILAETAIAQSHVDTDITSLDTACIGVDAIICAYALPLTALLDAQLQRLRAAERAGIKIFHASSWNTDWSNMKLGDHEIYDPLICFRRQATLTSPINPLYVFTGAFAETFWAVSPYESLHEEGLIWLPHTKKFKFWGDIDAKIEWTTLQDTAEYSIQLVASDKAAEGGEYYFYSGKHSLKELGSVYESIAGETVDYERRGNLNELRVLLEQKRREFGIKEWPEYIALVYSLFMMSGIGTSKRDDGISFPEVQKTPLEQFMLRVVEGHKE